MSLIELRMHQISRSGIAYAEIVEGYARSSVTEGLSPLKREGFVCHQNGFSNFEFQARRARLPEASQRAANDRGQAAAANWLGETLTAKPIPSPICCLSASLV